MARTVSLESKVFASAGIKVNPDDDTSAGADLLTITGGHIDAQGPFSSHVNFIENRQDALLNEVEKDGFLEWSELTTYSDGGFCKVGQQVYQSQSAGNIGNDPTDSEEWVAVVLGSVEDALVSDSNDSTRSLTGWVDGQSYTYNTVADMSADEKLAVGAKARTLGYWSTGDGGGNDYEIVAAGTGTDDGGSFIDLTGSGLQAKGLFPAESIPIEMFGAVADSESDQVDIFDAFAEYLRLTGKRGTLPKGTIRVSRSIDISGVYLEGCRQGYRGRLGTIIEGMTDGTLNRPEIIFEQKSTSGIALTYGIKGVQVRNAELALKMTYALWCYFEDFHAEEVTNGIECGDPDILGTLKNVFRLCHISADDTAVAVLGRDFSNSNCFQDCFFNGGFRAVYVDAGGTRAANNIFLNTQVAGDNLGFVLANTVSTTIDNCYMETVGPVIKIQGFSSLTQVRNPVMGTVKSVNPSNAPYFIWHESGSASLSLEGGWVTTSSSGEQDGLTFVHSDPETLRFRFYTRPHTTIDSSGFEWFGTGLPINGWEGLFNGTYTPEWTAASTDPILGNGTLAGSWAIHGDMCTVDISLTLGSTTEKGSGTWFISLPFSSSAVGEGRSGIAEFQFIGDGRVAAVARVNPGSSNLFFVGDNSPVFANSFTPRAWGDGDVIRATITYRMSPN